MHFIAERRWLESLWLLAVLYKANSGPEPHPGHAPALDYPEPCSGHCTSQGPCSLWDAGHQEKAAAASGRRWERWAGNILMFTHWGGQFFKMLSPEVRHGVTNPLLRPQLLSNLSHCSACSVFTWIMFFGCHRNPLCHSCGVFQAPLPCWDYFGAMLVHRWPHWGWAGHRAPVFQPKSFPSPNPSLPGAGSCVLGKVWSWALCGQQDSRVEVITTLLLLVSACVWWCRASLIKNHISALSRPGWWVQWNKHLFCCLSLEQTCSGES